MLVTRNLHYEASLLKKNCCTEERKDNACRQAATSENSHHFRESRAKGLLYPLAQIKVAGACYILSLTCGMSIGQPSILLPQLQSNDSDIPTDSEMGDFIVRMYSYAVPVGCLLGGIIMDRWGRRKAMLLSTALYVIGWLLITAAQDHGMIVAGKVLDGLCKGYTGTAVAVVITEFSEPMDRGSLTTISALLTPVGCALMYGLGTVLHWRVVTGLTMVLPLVAMVMFFFIPESPVWLVRKFRLIEARRTLRWIYGSYREKADVEHENLVRRRRIDEEETFRKCAGYSDPSIALINRFWWTLKAPYILKPFLITLVYNLLQILCGTHIFIIYSHKTTTTRIQINKAVDEYLIIVLAEVLRIPGLLIARVLIQWVGRRSFSISSGIGSFVCALALSAVVLIQTYQNKSIATGVESSIILVLVLIYITFNSWGFFVLSFYMTPELLPGKVRGIFSGIVYFVTGILMCASMELINTYFCTKSAHVGFWIFAFFSLVCTIFVYYFLPETKDRSLLQIEDYFRQSNIMWKTRDRSCSLDEGIDIRLTEFV